MMRRKHLITSMRQGWAKLLWLFLWLALLSPTFGVERFPPPDFESSYRMPPTTTPSPRAQWLAWLDVLVLLGALSLASYFVHKKRSRKPIYALTAFSVLYFGFYRKGCICAIGSIQDVTLALFNTGYAVPLTVLAFFLLPLIFTLMFGRTFCAAVCPLGAIQDVMVVRPVRVPGWIEHALGMVPYFYLGAAVLFAATGSAFIICKYDPFVALFRMDGRAVMLAVGAIFLLIGVFVGRPYCRFLCPYGAILNFVSRFARWNVTLTPEDCLHCQLCDVACPFEAIREPKAVTPPDVRRTAWRRVTAGLVLLPVLVLVCGWLGSRLAAPLSMVHAKVSLAERILAEETGKSIEPTDASKAFRQTGRPVQELYQEALAIRGQFVIGGWLLGAWFGLVMGLKLVALSLPHPAGILTESGENGKLPYEPDRARCVACGRCYTHCPKELVRIKKIQGKKVIPLTRA